MSPKESIIRHFLLNPDTEETALSLANRFNFRPELNDLQRSKAVRDLKRVSRGTRHPKMTYKPTLNKTKDSSYKENLDKGTLEISSVLSDEPRSPQEIIDIRLNNERIDPQAGNAAAHRYLAENGLNGSVQIEGLRVQVTVSDTVTMTLLALVGVGDQVVQTTRQVRVVDE